MTRREEIELAWLSKAVQSNHRYDEKTFKEAVEWADKTMIEKACELMMNFKNAAGEFPLYDYVGNFRKAMEE